MKLNLVGMAPLYAVLLLSCLASRAVTGSEANPPGWKTVDLIQTNHSTRVVTNLIEVRVPNNVFVTEYRTNWLQRTLTNVVARYQTNWTTVTNLETVMVTKTNWIKQSVTNVVEVNVAASKEETTRPEPKVEILPAESPADVLVLETSKTARPSGGSGVEMQFKLRLSSDAAALLQVQQWRVERDDGAVLFFAQNQEFKKIMPPGRYQIQVKARRAADSPLLTLQSGLDVTADEVARQ
jgi:hypothetical protein